MMEGQQYAYEGVLGGKTGYTEAAGNTLVTYARRGNMYLVAVVMKSVNGAYSDTAALLDYGFNIFSRVSVYEGAAPVSASYLPAEKYIRKDYRDSVLFYSLRTPTVTLPNGIGTDRLASSRRLVEECGGPSHPGDFLRIQRMAGGNRQPLSEDTVFRSSPVTRRQNAFCASCGGNPVFHGFPPLFLRPRSLWSSRHNIRPRLFCGSGSCL